MMKYKLSICIFSLFSAIIIEAQCLIPVQIEQNPPLSVVAQTVTASLPNEGLTLGSDIIVDGGDGVYRYIWTNGQGTVLNTSTTLFVTSIGEYYLQVIDGHDCSVSVKFNITSADGINNVEGGDFSLKNENGLLTIQSGKNLRQIRIVSASGQLVKKISNIHKSDRIDIKINDINKGLYLVGCAYSDGNEIIKHLIIK
jgi:hypothetical protein